MLTSSLQRGLRLVRAGNWWDAKIPPLLLGGYFTLLAFDVDVGEAATRLAAFLGSVVCVAAYGHVVNDVFDVEVDHLADKPNAMASRSAMSRAGWCLVLLAAGCLPALLARYSPLAWLLLGLNYVWPTLYSAPPVRLKERGLLGVVCDAAGSHLTPTLLAITVCAPAGAAASTGLLDFRMVLVVWAGALGLKGIVHHELADRDNDRTSGVVTFATQAAPGQIERFLPRYNLWVELPISGALVVAVAPWCPLAAVCLTIYCAVETLKFRLGFQFALSSDRRTIRASIPFANEAAYTFWLPLAGVFQLGLQGPAWFWLPALHLLAFRGASVASRADLAGVWRGCSQRYRWLHFNR